MITDTVNYHVMKRYNCKLYSSDAIHTSARRPVRFVVGTTAVVLLLLYMWDRNDVIIFRAQLTRALRRNCMGTNRMDLNRSATINVFGFIPPLIAYLVIKSNDTHDSKLRLSLIFG